MPKGRPSNPARASRPEPPDGLTRYRAKRDFARTPERAATTKPSRRKARALAFVVHKHAARRLHYDLRLELDGVLKSWAVPQGPSLDPADRRLAVHVEDHPLEYGSFEGVIPKGQYGGGTVMLWDRGIWEPQGDAAADYAAGKLKLRLAGEKLKGGWTLVRMGGGAARPKDLWLLIKERDAHAQEHRSVPAGEEDQSVLSRLTMAEIAAAPAAVWSAARTDAGPVGREKVGGGPRPTFVSPQLATLADRAPQGQEWLFEIKQDGYRAQLQIHAGTTAVRTRNGHDWTDRFRTIAGDGAALTVASALLDGEIVVLDDSGVSNFGLLKEALRQRNDVQMLFFAFDLLHLDGEDLRPRPLRERKERLAALLSGLPPDSRLRFAEHLIADGPAIWRHACRLGAEGIIAKRANAPYRSGRGDAWLKVKCQTRQEFVVGGYAPLKGKIFGLGSLLLGVYEGGELVHVGRVGTGWDAVTAEALRARLDDLRAERPPFARLPKAARRAACWVHPELVAEVRFQPWTADGLLRHASFQGLREDKDPQSVSRERAAAPAPAVRHAAASAASALADNGLELHGVRISNAGREVLDRPWLTKGDVARYYATMADLILPHVAGRPLSVIRCPDRLDEGCFYQRHPAAGMPPSIRTVEGAGRAGKVPYLAIDGAEGLLALIQFGAVELHPNGARADRPDRPDRLVFDLDPGEGVAWARVVEAAHELKERLTALGLASFPRTTGGKGLHLVVPVERRHAWPEAKAFASGIARAMQADSPGRYTAVLAKAARADRIFVDYLRNDRTATAVASYSLRSRPGAPVAMPLSWAEVTPRLKPHAFTLLTAPALAQARQDPWEGAGRMRQRLPAPARRLAA